MSDEKLFVRVNKDRIYGFTKALANRKDAVVMTESDVKAWRKTQLRLAEGKPPRVRPTRTKLVKKPKGGKKKKTVIPNKEAPAKTTAVPTALEELLGDGTHIPSGD